MSYAAEMVSWYRLRYSSQQSGSAFRWWQRRTPAFAIVIQAIKSQAFLLFSRQLTDLRDRNGQMGVVALATDGKHLYFTWEEELSDIWVMDVEHED